METITTKAVSEAGVAVPEWMIVLAERVTPHYQRDDVRSTLESVECRSRRDCMWVSAAAVATVIKAQVRDTFDSRMLMGEVLSLYVAVCFPDVNAPFLPFAILLTFLLALFRVRDAYAYPAEGSTAEMFVDVAFAAGFVIALETFLTFQAPRLALSSLKVIFAVIATVAISHMRMFLRRQDSGDPRLRKLKESSIAVWHMNVLWLLTVVPLQITSGIAVPGSHLRDQLISRLPSLLMLAAIRLKKQNFESIWRKPVLSPVGIPHVAELSHMLGILWFRDKVSKFRSDLCAEVLYFSVLAFPLAEAAWRWSSGDPSAADVDWLQVGVNATAVILLAVIWIYIKKLNERLAGAIRQEIVRRQEEWAK